MTVALALLKRLWWSIPMALLLAALLITRGTLASTKKDLAACTKHGIEVQAAYDQFVADVKAKTEQARAADAAHAAAVEKQQDQISKERVSDYESRLADLRARYDALRVRSQGSTSASNSSGSGIPTVPGVPSPSSGIDVAAPIDPFACDANTVQLKALQDWVREQEGVRRTFEN